MRYGREEGEGRLGQAARWSDSPSPPPHPDPLLCAAAGTARPPSVPPRPLTALPSGPLLRVAASGKEPTTAAPLGALVLQPGPPGPGCGAAAAPRAPGPPVPPPGLCCTCCGLSCPASRGGSLAPSSLNFASLRAAPAPPHRMHRRRRSPPRPGKGSATLPPHALPRCRDGGQLPAQGRSPVPAPGGRDRGRRHQSALVRLPFGANPVPQAERPSPGPGDSKPLPTT